MIVNQWVPAAHQGDAIGDRPAACAACCASSGTSPTSTRMTIDDDLRGDVRAVDRRRRRSAAT